MRAIPKMKVEVPADSVSVKEIVKAIADHSGPFYVRITRGMQGANSPIIYENGFEYKLGRGNVTREGSDVAIFACGMMVAQALRAAESLKEKGVNAAVIDIHSIKPIDQELIVKFARSCGCVVTAEEHNIFGGLGSAIAEVVSEIYPVPVRRIGVNDTFGESGEAQELFEKYGLTPDKIAEAALAVRSMKR
jgi:transketolase